MRSKRTNDIQIRTSDDPRDAAHPFHVVRLAHSGETHDRVLVRSATLDLAKLAAAALL